MIHVDRLSRLLGLHQAYQRFLLAVAWDCGWLTAGHRGHTSVILPSPDAEKLMGQGPAEIQQIAIQRLPTLSSWDESRSLPCRLGTPGPMTHLVGRLRGYLAELTATLHVWSPLTGLSGLLIGLPGFRRLLATAPDLAPIAEILDSPQRCASPLLASLATTIWWTQQVDMARDQADVVYVRAAEQLSASEEPAGTALPLRVAANGEFFLPLVTPLPRLQKAAEFADILAVDQACRFRMTKSSLTRASKRSWSARDVEVFLACEVPQNILHLIRETLPSPQE